MSTAPAYHMFATIITSQHVLPFGWFRAFTHQVLGLTKGIYTAFPSPVPRHATLLSFLGLTFVPIPVNSDPGKDSIPSEWDWSWGLYIPCVHLSQSKDNTIDNEISGLAENGASQSNTELEEDGTNAKEGESATQSALNNDIHPPISDQALTLQTPQKKARDLSYVLQSCKWIQH